MRILYLKSKKNVSVASAAAERLENPVRFVEDPKNANFHERKLSLFIKNCFCYFFSFFLDMVLWTFFHADEISDYGNIV